MKHKKIRPKHKKAIQSKRRATLKKYVSSKVTPGEAMINLRMRQLLVVCHRTDICTRPVTLPNPFNDQIVSDFRRH